MTKTYISYWRNNQAKMLEIAFVLNLGFRKFEFVSDFVLRISKLRESDLANNLEIKKSYPFE